MNKGQALSRTTVCECGYCYTGHPNQMKTARRLHSKVCQLQIQYVKNGGLIEPHVEPPLSYSIKQTSNKNQSYIIPPNVNKIETIAPIRITHAGTNQLIHTQIEGSVFITDLP